MNPSQYAGIIFFPNVPSGFTSTSLNQSELMFQTEYELNLIPNKLVLPGAYTAIPMPGYRPGIPWANIFTLRLVVGL